MFSAGGPHQTPRVRDLSEQSGTGVCLTPQPLHHGRHRGGGGRGILVPNSVADPDPGSGIGCLFDSGIRDGRSQHPDPGSGMNNPDHIF